MRRIMARWWELWRGSSPRGRVSAVIAALLAVVAVAALPAPWKGIFRDRGTDAGDPEIEVAVFYGGIGIDWYLQAARDFEKERAKAGSSVRVNLWGDPRTVDKIRPRILRGDPPDICRVYLLPFWKFVTAGELLPLDPYLDQPSLDDPTRTWRELFIPGTLEPYQYEGKTYALPLCYGTGGLWYDAKLFREHGWDVPRTWSELLALCQRINDAGLVPIAFQGKYMIYAINLIHWPVVELWGGLETFYRCQNLEPGAFTDPAFVEASRIVQHLARAYFDEHCLSMSHTEAQLTFCNRKAAMVPCGMWLENEMRDSLPEDFELRMFTLPPIEGGRGYPGALFVIGGEDFWLFKASQHPDIAADFLRTAMSRPHLREFLRQVGNPVTLTGVNETVDVSPAIRSALDVVESSTFDYRDRLSDMFPTWYIEVQTPAMQQLLSGGITPEEFGKRLEAGIRAVCNDAEVYKPAPVDWRAQLEAVRARRPRPATDAAERGDRPAAPPGA